MQANLPWEEVQLSAPTIIKKVWPIQSLQNEYLYELSNPLDQHDLEKTIKNAKDLKKSVDFATAISYIGDKFNFYRYPLRDLTLTNYEDKTKTSTGATTSTTSTPASPSNGGEGGTGGY